MPNSVIIGRLRAINAEGIVLDGDLRITLAPRLSVGNMPLGTSLTIVVERRSDGELVAITWKQT